MVASVIQLVGLAVICLAVAAVSLPLAGVTAGIMLLLIGVALERR